MVQLIYSSFQNSKKCRRIILATSRMNFFRKNSWECQESNPGLLGEKCKCYLCAMPPAPPPLTQYIIRLLEPQQSKPTCLWVLCLDLKVLNCLEFLEIIKQWDLMIKFFLFKCCLRAKSSCWNRTELEKIEPMRESPAENQNKKFTVGCQIFSPLQPPEWRNIGFFSTFLMKF